MTSSAIAQTTGHMPLPNGTHAAPRMNGAAAPGHDLWPEVGLADAEALPAARPGIAVADWDVMFDAVRARLIHSVGERPDERPDRPQHSAELSARLVQAAVLDCVGALDQLHAALKQERSPRPTP